MLTIRKPKTHLSAVESKQFLLTEILKSWNLTSLLPISFYFFKVSVYMFDGFLFMREENTFKKTPHEFVLIFDFILKKFWRSFEEVQCNLKCLKYDSHSLKKWKEILILILDRKNVVHNCEMKNEKWEWLYGDIELYQNCKNLRR